MPNDIHSPAHFSVALSQVNQVNHAKLVGTGNPLSSEAVESNEAVGLTTEDRLFFHLRQSTHLDRCVFNPGDQIAVRGERVHLAHIVISGEMTASDVKNNFTLGSGSVIGLAEGMANLPHSFTVTAKETVHTRSIPVADAQQELVRLNAGLRGIFRTAIARTLDLKEIPENLA